MREIEEYVAHLRDDGRALADAAERAGFDAPVPSCPEWTVRDLVHHQGDIHRWAAANLTRDNSEPMDDDERQACVLTWPDDDAALLDWFRDGHAHLVKTLESVPDDVVAWSFLPAPNARHFWARRQAHETAIHRGDSESASGEVTAYEPTFAADGIDELLMGFAGRPGKAMSSEPRTLAIEPTDAPGRWLMTLGPERRAVADSGDAADCTVAGPASDLYLLLWNRRAPDGLDVSGDSGLLALWRDSLKVQWGGPTKKK